jgi:hypothetical protein
MDINLKTSKICLYLQMQKSQRNTHRHTQNRNTHKYLIELKLEFSKVVGLRLI